MEIRETRAIVDFDKLLPMEEAIRLKGRDVMPIQSTRAFIERQMARNPNFHFLIAEDDGKIIGYTFFIINNEPGTQTFHICRVWTDPTRPDVADRFDFIRKETMKHLGIKRTTIEIYKNDKALMRKWGFKKRSIIMEKGI